MHAECGFVVVRVVRLHRPQHADVVDARANVRKQFADFDARATVWGELPLRLFEIAGEVAELALPVIDGDRVAVIGEQPRLGIERLDVRHAAGHVEKDDRAGTGGEMGLVGGEGIDVGRRGARCGGGLEIGQHAVQGQRAEPAEGVAEHGAARGAEMLAVGLHDGSIRATRSCGTVPGVFF